MNQEPTNPVEVSGSDTHKIGSYITGYLLSIVLTVIAYLLVDHQSLSGNAIVAAIIALGVIQFIVQLYYFLHLGVNTKSRWRLFVLLFMLMVVIIIVAGSLWIMTNLNYRMTPEQVNQYMSNQGGF